MAVPLSRITQALNGKVRALDTSIPESDMLGKASTGNRFSNSPRIQPLYFLAWSGFVFMPGTKHWKAYICIYPGWYATRSSPFLDLLLNSIPCFSVQESRVLVTNDIQLTRELHIIRASLLHYTSLLENFRKAVWFIRNTPNPAMLDSPAWEESNVLMDRECDTLISEIERLEMYRRMQEMRVENVMNLVSLNYAVILPPGR